MERQTTGVQVSCLQCEASYTKPMDGGTVQQNPGCPRCGYLGWAVLTQPRRHHFGAGLQQLQLAQPR